VPESAGQRIEWERSILGQPVTVHPLELAAELPLTRVSLRALPGTTGQPVTIAGARLPGWTGGPGYYLGDGDCFVMVRGDERPDPWQPVVLRGLWQRDAYGSGWFQASEWQPVPT
jgi:hypothetical protein